MIQNTYLVVLYHFSFYGKKVRDKCLKGYNEIILPSVGNSSDA